MTLPYVVDVQLRTPAGVLIEHLPVDTKNAGAITDDRTAAVRRTISTPIRIVDPTGVLIPQYATDVLHPYSNNELWIFRGGAQLGIFGLSKPDIHVANDGWYLGLTGSDRAHRIQRVAWTDAYAITGDPNLNTAARALINNRLAAAGVSGWNFNLAPTSAIVPDTTFGLISGEFSVTDPWTDVQGLFTDNGEELFFDNQGAIVAQPVPNPASFAPVASYVDGVGGTIVDIERIIDVDQSYSGVLVIGTGDETGSPVNYVLWDPVSVSLMGEVPYVYSSSTIQSVSQAQAAAQALLPTVIGAQETATIQALPDPGRRSSDVVYIQSARARVAANYLVQQVRQPLGVAEPMTITASRQVPA